MLEKENCITYNKIAGLNAMLPFENFEQMITLPIFEKDLIEVYFKYNFI